MSSWLDGSRLTDSIDMLCLAFRFLLDLDSVLFVFGFDLVLGFESPLGLSPTKSISIQVRIESFIWV